MQNSKIPLNVKQPAKKQATNTKTLSAGNMLYAKGHHNTKTLAANTKQHKQVKSPHLIFVRASKHKNADGSNMHYI